MYSEDILSARTLAHAIRDGGYYSPEEVADTLENLARAIERLEYEADEAWSVEQP